MPKALIDINQLNTLLGYSVRKIINDNGENWIILLKDSKSIIEDRIDEIEKIFGYYNNPSKRTSEYELGRQMIREVLSNPN